MKIPRRPFVSWCALTISLSLCSDSPAQGEASQTQTAREEETVAPEPRPVEIRLGLTIVEFARINNRDETFDLHGYLEVNWNDPRRKRNPGTAPKRPGQEWRRLRPSAEVWVPRLSFVNALEEAKLLGQADVFADDDGNMFQGLDFSGKFSMILDLRRFPFDSQVMRIRIQPTDADMNEVKLVAAPNRSGVLEGAFLSDWDVGRSEARSEAFHYRTDGSNYSQFVLETTIQRRSTFYFYRVLLPLTLLVIASWVVFWFDVTQLQPQISTALGIMLSTVLFSFGTDFGMPRAPYLTLVDRQVLLSFMFAFFAIMAVGCLHVALRRSGQGVAERYQRKLRAFMPLAYVIALAVTHGTR
jgi:hypothetical protein